MKKVFTYVLLLVLTSGAMVQAQVEWKYDRQKNTATKPMSCG